jgi:hypothetical protein
LQDLLINPESGTERRLILLRRLINTLKDSIEELEKSVRLNESLMNRVNERAPIKMRIV